MPNRTWIDRLGRSYTYRPHEASLVATAEVSLGTRAVLAVAEAARCLGEVPSLPLSGLATVLYRSEAAASSLIEGIEAGPRRLLEAEFATPGEIDDPRAQRVVSNLRALLDAVHTSFPPRTRDLLRWHRLLAEGHPELRPEHLGDFRTEQNWIGGDSTGPRDAVFVPPVPEEVPALIDDLLRFAERREVAGIPSALIAHAQFEVIHPFVDGNGRVGRMLLQHVLVHRQELEVPIPLSIPWSWEPDRYLTALRQYQSGDIESWVEFGATSIVRAVDWLRAARRAIDGVLRELAARSAARGRSISARIIENLPADPLIDATTVAERYGVSKQAASQALSRLASRGVIAEYAFTKRTRSTGRPRKYFSSPELMSLLGRLSTRAAMG